MTQERPQLALLDLILPGTDGIELMNAVLKPAEVPVLFLSIYGQDQTIARAFYMETTDYIVKPLCPTDLVARNWAALRRHTASEQPKPTQPVCAGGPRHRCTTTGV